jgi:predicted dehydrogenase
MRRRTFLKTAVSAAAACGLPTLVPHSVFGQNAPSNRINVGFIGLGNQSTIDLPAFLGHADAQVLAVCDVNTGSDGYLPGQFRGRKPGQDQVNAYYAQSTSSGQYKGCDAYTDFREVLARKDIDVVTVVVPDHWHGLMTVMACQSGKDVYC